MSEASERSEASGVSEVEQSFGEFGFSGTNLVSVEWNEFSFSRAERSEELF